MPHCIIEYASHIEKIVAPEKLLDAVFQAVSDSPLFEPQNVSVRLYPHELFREGNGKQHFVHVAIKLYAGRTDEQKGVLTQQVGQAIKQLGIRDALISCECVETHKASMYRVVTD